MRSTPIAMLVCLLLACGGDDTADDTVGPDSGPPGADAGADAGGGGNVADFDSCALDSDCAAGSDCRQVGWFSGNFKVCMPQCESTSDCPFSTYCYPEVPGQPSFAFMRDHCWFSLCGPDPGVGTIGGACKMGEEVGLPAGEQLDGFCFPINDASFGQCLEAGDVPPGGTCDFANVTRGGENCDATSLCFGTQGAQTGTCLESCDPRRVLTGEPGNCGAVSGTQCVDDSEITTFDDNGTTTVITATFGHCDNVAACTLMDSSVCPSGEGCVQTNPVRPTGICDPIGFGELPFGASCAPPSQSTPAAQRCASGAFCFGAQGAATCQPFCDRPESGTPAVDCAAAVAGTACTQVLWDSGTDMTAGTPDDNHTQGWGLCQ